MLYLLHVQPRHPELSPPCLWATRTGTPGSQRWWTETQTCQTYYGSAPLQCLWGNFKFQSRTTDLSYHYYYRQHSLCLFLLPAPSLPSPTQPNRASSWQPLHTPRLSVSSRRRKRSNSALALGLYATVAAQPVIKDELCYTKCVICISKTVCTYECLFAFGWSQDVCVAESTDKHDRFERLQSYGSRAQVLHGDIPHLQHRCRHESHTHTSFTAYVKIHPVNKAQKSYLKTGHIQRHRHLSVSVTALLPDHSNTRLPCSWNTHQRERGWNKNIKQGKESF